MTACKKSKSARNNFGKLINQFKPKTKTLVRKLERILIKLYIYVYIYKEDLVLNNQPTNHEQ